MAAAMTEGVFVPVSAPSLSIPYRIIKSKRKTWALSLEEDLTLSVRLPLSASAVSAKSLLSQKEHWIVSKYTQASRQRSAQPVSQLTPAQRIALEMRYRQAAKEYFPARVAYYEKQIGVTHTTITIRDQKTRWGSCSARGGLNFNWRLMLAPPRVLDYVVVHELCHRKEMNHSKAFWHTVEMVLPDYRKLQKWLQDNGRSLVL